MEKGKVREVKITLFAAGAASFRALTFPVFPIRQCLSDASRVTSCEGACRILKVF